MRTIAIINQKGGCGKTTTAINLAGALAERGERTLLVDLDPQSHCAAGLAVPEGRIDLHIGDAMLAPDEEPLDRVRLLWRVSRDLDLVPSTVRLAGLEAARGGLASLSERDTRLRSVLDRLAAPDDAAPGVPRYRWCIIDCPPSIGLLTFNALRAATDILIPVEMSFFAMRGAARQVNTIRTLARRAGGSAPFRLLATLHNPDNPLSRTLLGELGERFGERVAPTVIRFDPRLREAASIGQPIIEYAPDSDGARDYRAFMEWLIEHEPAAEAEPAPDAVVQAVDTARDAASPPLEAPGPVGAGARSLDPVLTRAAELASRIRQLAHRSEVFQQRLATDPTVRREPGEERRVVFGATAIDGGARFTHPAEAGVPVFVAGDFNNWSDTTHPLTLNPASGALEADIEMPPGARQYRLVVGGRWITDPYNPNSQENPFGDRNSVVFVRPASPRPVAVPPGAAAHA